MSVKKNTSLSLRGRIKKQTGFTLTELLVSLGILGIISVSSFMVFGQALSAWNKIVRQAKVLEMTRTTFSSISRDLNAAVIAKWSDSQNGSAPLFYMANHQLSYGTGLYKIDNDKLVFCTNNFNPRVYDQNCDYYKNDASVIGEVKYEVMSLSGTTYSSRSNSSLSDINSHELVRSYDCPADFVSMDNLSTATYDADIPIGLAVVSMNVELYCADSPSSYEWKPDAGDTEWKETVLPKAVRITLGIRRNFKKYFDNLITADQPSEMVLDYYYFMVELPSRERT